MTGGIPARAPGCPPWCDSGILHNCGLHTSAAPHITGFRAHPAGYATAIAVHDDSRPRTEVHVFAGDRAADETRAYLTFGDPGQARQAAALLEFLASATAGQHRDLSRQVRQAADLIDGGGER